MTARILLVDDDPVVHDLVERTLDRHDYELVKAFDGSEGLEKALANSPDLIISDVLMPEMDGWTFVKELRSRKELMLVPVIFLTALGSPKHRFLGYRLGADDYCPKPFDIKDLRARVEKVLSRGRHAKRHHEELLQQEEASSPNTYRSTEEIVSLAGSLEQMSVSTVLTILEMEKKSGVFVVKAEKEGRMLLSDGIVVDAFLEDQSLVGVEAVYDMVGWTVGGFTFYSKKIDVDNRIKMGTPFILMEAARRADDANSSDEGQSR